MTRPRSGFVNLCWPQQNYFEIIIKSFKYLESHPSCPDAQPLLHSGVSYWSAYLQNVHHTVFFAGLIHAAVGFHTL